MKSVLVLLSTYNGERFLREQLDSLYSQINVNVQILARDDGSKDGTRDILSEYQKSKGQLTIIDGSNIGAANSFFRLVEYASEYCHQYDYYAYCDQDDVWFREKLEKAVNLLEKSDNHYKLAYSSLTTTDEYLTQLGSDTVDGTVYTLNSNIVSNHIAGCCQVFNRGLLEKINLINSYKTNRRITFLHDTWTSLVAFALDGYIIHDSFPRMYYRQHSGNVVGNNKGGLLHLYKKRISRYINAESRPKSDKCKCIQDLMWNEIPYKNRPFIDLCANYHDNILKKLKLIFSTQLYASSMGENIGALILVLFNKF